MKLKRVKWKNVIILLLFIALLIVFIYSLIKVLNWYKENKENKNIIDSFDSGLVTEINNGSNIEIIEQSSSIEEDNPYWDYIKMNLIDVSFDELKSTNKDTVGWIQVNGTNINYPIVQTKDNDYYLTHSFEKKWNSAGWIFMDYRNNSNNFNKNTIIYGHSRLDTTMFGSLKNILKSNWYKNKDNYVIKLSTEHENTLWQVFSVYHIPTTSDYLQIDFGSNAEYQEFLNMISSRSAFKFNTSVNSTDKIVTLSTCYKDDEKVVMHAKLIKKQTR